MTERGIDAWTGAAWMFGVVYRERASLQQAYDLHSALLRPRG